ncbi:MAG: M60 family metallopeptidase [Paludibacter sp.]|nr:M60 family metallopeptidase [Paludibacter sp.]
MKTKSPYFLGNIILFIYLSCFNFQINATINETIPYTSVCPDDVSLIIASASASSTQPGNEISNSFDGDKSTLYHSTWGSTTFPVFLTYNFSKESNLDYILYSTRIDGNPNGNFKEIEIQARTYGSPTFHTVLSTNLNGTAGTKRINIDSTLINIIAVKIIVKSGAGNNTGFAACSEIEFYKINTDAFDPCTIFTDKSFSAIKPDISRNQLEEIPNTFYKQLALDIFDGIYPAEFRVQHYKAWPHPDVFSKNNRVGTYSLCDNPTGIFVRSGDTVMVFVNDTYGYDISLTLKNYNKPEGNGYWENSYYALSKGANKIIADREGLFYVFYHTPYHLTAPKVKIHFAYGKINGYYDAEKHTENDWNRILNVTQYEYFDALGKYAHLSFPTNKFKTNASDSGPQLIKAYNELVYAEREFMGYYHYADRDPYNRSHFVVMYHNYMYSTSYHTGYNISTMDGLTNVTNLYKFPWGPAHEVGHSNQTIPLLKWVGTTEVTNNVQSAYVQTLWGNTCRLTNENRYQEAFDNLLIPQKAHCQVDIWQKLVPFWQLQLFFSNVLNRKMFYASIYEGARTRPTGSNAGEYQLNFVKLVTDSSKVDLTEFFSVWGFLKPVDQLVDDYKKEQLTITQNQSTSVLNYIQNNHFPALPYKIQYINDTNWPIYKNKSLVEKGTAVRIGNTYKMNNWKNVVAYEAWQGDSLVSISQTDQIVVGGEMNTFSKVYAIQYDGSKIEVIPQLSVDVETPKLSTDLHEYWYYVKNMCNETTNPWGNTPRSFNAMTASAAGSIVQATSVPVFKTQRWKLVDVNGKTGLVNETGLYLGEDLKATTIPFGWTLEKVTQGGSSGYRFVSYDATTLKTVVHLSTSLTLINYLRDDAASVWQFIPADQVKKSTDNENQLYRVNSLRYEDAVIGTFLTYDTATNTVFPATSGEKRWKISFYDAITGACHIVCEEGKYLALSGSIPVLSNTPANWYIYMGTCDGMTGYRIATSTASIPYMLNLTSNGTLDMSNSFSTACLWNFLPANLTSTKNPFKNKVNAYVENKKIKVDGTDRFFIHSVRGQPVENTNLQSGVYIVTSQYFTTKVIVK